MIHNSHTRKKRDLESSGGTSFPEVEHLESCLSSLRFFNRWLNVTSKSWRWTSMMSAETSSSSLESFSISLPTSFSSFFNLSIVTCIFNWLLQIFSPKNPIVVFERQQETEVHKFLRSNTHTAGNLNSKLLFSPFYQKSKDSPWISFVNSAHFTKFCQKSEVEQNFRENTQPSKICQKLESALKFSWNQLTLQTLL